MINMPVNRGRAARIFSVSSPVGGWNARDPLAEMKETDAVTLDNFYCTPYDVKVRNGYSVQTSGIAAKVATLASYSPLTGGEKLFSFSGTNVYDSSSPGAVGSPVIQSNSTSYWQKTNFGTSGGQFLVAVSGGDLPLVYNGTVWTNIFSAAFDPAISTLTSVGTTATATMTNPHNLKTGMSITIAGVTPAGYNGTYIVTVTSTTAFTYTLAGALGVVTVMGTATPTLNLAITGIDPTRFIQTAVFKQRLWFVEKESSKVWYLPVLSLGGAALSVDFGSFFSKGGYLMAMADWSLDAGYGMDDYAVFISSNGQCVVFKGTDPSSAATWALIGVYDIGSPIGRNCFCKYAGDLTIICEDGLMLLSKALMSTRVNSREALTDKIQHEISSYITSFATLPGWEVTLYGKENMLLLNVPISSTQAYQFVMNTISGAWSSFSGWNAYCWVLHNDDIYFGGETFVAKAWDTFSDNGANIDFEAQQSFNYCRSRSLKRVNMLRPIISTDGSPNILLGINVDFDMTDPTGVPSFSPVTTAVWDVDLWDVGVWGGDLAIIKDWQTAFGIGYCLSAHMKGALSGCQLRWAATDLMIQDGGLL